MKQVKITVSGQVQGVGFRFATAGRAKEFEINGWVRNLENGSVEILAQGEEENLKRFINWCRLGPELAEVNEVKVEALETPKTYSDFQILA